MKNSSAIITMMTLLTCLTSCTYNVSMAHTQGTATDTIDDTASNTPNVSPNINIPVTPGAGLGLGK
jgi:hypothetical protein